MVHQMGTFSFGDFSYASVHPCQVSCVVRRAPCAVRRAPCDAIRITQYGAEPHFSDGLPSPEANRKCRRQGEALHGIKPAFGGTPVPDCLQASDINTLPKYCQTCRPARSSPPSAGLPDLPRSVASTMTSTASLSYFALRPSFFGADC